MSIVGQAKAGKGDHLKANLKALRREIRAVKVAIEAIDEGAEKEKRESQDLGMAGPEASTRGNRENDPQAPKEAGSPEKVGHDDKGLQRAGLAQRLSDLVARREQLKASL